MNRDFKTGILFALLTAFISGLSIFYNKMVITRGIDPLIFNIYKNGGVALILTLLLFSFPKNNNLFRLSPKIWKRLLLIGLVGGSIPFILFFEGLKTVSATNANLIHKSLFIWVALMALPFLGEKLNLWQIIGYLFIAWSNFFIGGFSWFSGNIGEIMILTATILWSVENIIAKITLKDADHKIVAWGRMFFGSLVLIFIALIQNRFTFINLKDLPVLSGSIIFLSAYVICWYKALKLAPATLVTSILILAAPITNILTAVFITHAIAPAQLINLIFSLFGVALITLLVSVNRQTKYTSFLA